MNQEQLTTPELALLMDDLKYFPESAKYKIHDALTGAEFESEFCAAAKTKLQDLIDDTQILMDRLTEAEKIIANKMKVYL